MKKMRFWVDIIITLLALTMIAIGIYFCIESVWTSGDALNDTIINEAIGGFKITTGIMTLLNMFNKKMERK